ncbi:MAG: orotidine 5'-phosphate decarboxylase [Synergistaceae bacterium]|jgi:3-hexulose-6-phosphate synthase/6-phospho-3-hexuloisomerase|nr:orotidine 5'-phosphate decarboxylase [Synergistaceae bacterium]
MKRSIYTQVSLDLTNIKEALPMAEIAAHVGIDWLEAGTPLILGEGLRAVKALRERFPEHPIVADLKTMDGAGLEAEMMLDAGATHVVVMSQAHWASVTEMVKMADRYKGYVMADVLNAPDKALAAKRMQELGADWIIVHTGYDERRYVKGGSPLDDLQSVLDAVSIPVQAVGGLSIEQALQCVKMGADSLVIGAPLAINADKFAVGDDYETILKDVVGRVKSMSD